MTVLEDIRSGNINPDDLNADLFEGTKNKILSGIKKSIKVDVTAIDYSTQDYNFLSQIRSNVYAFAGAKTRQQLNDMRNMLLDDKGNVVSFSEFQKKTDEYRKNVMGLNEQYNKTWLETEYNTAIAQAQSAAAWKEYEANKDLYPNLRYVTAGDEHVRSSHAILDGIVKSIDDPVWNTISPVKDWNCRCRLEPTDDVAHDGPLPKGFNPNPVFKGNVGKTGSIFSEKHPYFKKNRIDKLKVQKAVDGYWAKERAAINRAIYNDYADDAAYVQELFNQETGGFIVRHTNAQYLPAQRPPAESDIINKLVQKGNRVVIPEYQQVPYTKNFDLSIDGADWDIKTISGDVKRKTEERIKDAMQQADNVILHFEEQPDINEIRRGLGNVKKEARLNAVMIMFEDVVAVISKAEITRKDFKALNLLK
ncbi:MAG: phage minor head protein [Flavipsychrobacter sp.]